MKSTPVAMLCGLELVLASKLVEEAALAKALKSGAGVVRCCALK